jgi:hypothetical protein
MLPETTREKLRAAIAEFDRRLRDTQDWQGWQENRAHKYAISYKSRLYPAKKIVSLATGKPVRHFSGGDETNTFLQRYKFNLIPLRTQETGPPGGDRRNSETSVLPVRNSARSIVRLMNRQQSRIATRLRPTRRLWSAGSVDMQQRRTGSLSTYAPSGSNHGHPSRTSRTLTSHGRMGTGCLYAR